ncbi:aldo/keto reductase [Gordonia sp. ABSL1-1]|uniref:aldo/keto reductase n=1 Tax=Gordonia sp. ABSL1-1 TaxID=3053923 RepID=UPI002572A447|nr:aldo/keto reductase [Gordonia sp. ABSL1-1]MDL9938152.1 aldo/keto reductase [Gordonia sp. ABSL1-1]
MASNAPQVPDLTLNNGVAIPQVGLGVFQIPPEQTEEATLAALELGYRHIDTAQMYGNEREVGRAVRASGISRDEIFVTSKLNNNGHAPDADTSAAIARSRDALDIGPIDLYLIHWPLPAVGSFVETWRALEQAYRSGDLRSIGVSNFSEQHLTRLLGETDVVPAVNQIEVHPYFAQNALRQFNTEHGIHTEAWSPIAQGAVLDDPTVVRIAEAVDRSPAQIVLRWHIQRGDIVFPKSVTRSRIADNLALFDFSLTDEQVSAIDGLDVGGRRGPNPDEFNWVP